MTAPVVSRTRVPYTQATALRSALITGIAFLVSAFISLAYTRAGGGVALVWLSNAIVAARLHALPRRVWPVTIVVCWVASVLATGLFGLGWAPAPLIATVNMFEAAAAAVVLGRIDHAHWPQDIGRWMAVYVVGIGVAIPATGAIVAAGICAVLPGQGSMPNFTNWLLGHGLGLLIFLPAGSQLCRAIEERTPLLDARTRGQTALLVLVMLAVSVAVFVQPVRPFMVFPLLVVLFGAIWANAFVALALPAILALAGGILTLQGHGPIAQIDMVAGELQLFTSRLHLLQVYLGITIICTLPIVAEQERRRRRMDDLAHSEARYRLLSDHVSDVIIHLDRAGTIAFASPSIEALTGHNAQAVVGAHFAELVAEPFRATVEAACLSAYATPGVPVAAEFRSQPQGKPVRWLETHFRAVSAGHGDEDGLVCVTRDISQRKRIEEDLSRAALTDLLTGIPNRRAFFETAANMAANSQPAALAVIDIDFFKQVNDQHGHAVGDKVLRAFAETAVGAVRSTDFVARIGGEEFAVLLPETELGHAEKVCERLARAVSAMAIEAPLGSVRITISAGIAPLGASPDAALAVADAALYRAKAEGRARLRVAA